SFTDARFVASFESQLSQFCEGQGDHALITQLSCQRQALGETSFRLLPAIPASPTFPTSPAFPAFPIHSLKAYQRYPEVIETRANATYVITGPAQFEALPEQICRSRVVPSVLCY